jgi:hypothetical protein
MTEREGYTLEVHYGDRDGGFTQVATRYGDFGSDTASVLAAALDSADEFLEDLWREFNVVNGDELPTYLGIRSMMVGDRVTIRFRYNFWNGVWEGHKTWQVAMVGWKLVEDVDTHTQERVMS